MAGFGGAVKLTGESEYRRALQQITQNLREVSAQMNLVSSSYDKNDRSVQAITSKQDVLNQKLTTQKEKVATLQAQYDAMSKKYADNTTKHDALVKSYEAEKEKLEQIGKTLGTTSTEYQQQKAKVDEMAKAVKSSTTAQDANEKSMSKMRTEIANAQADCNKTARELDNLGEEAEEAGRDARDAGDGFTIFKGVVADLASSAIQSAIRGIKELTGQIVNIGKQSYSSYANYEQLVGGVETLFGSSSDQLLKYAQNAYKTAGLSANDYMEQATSFSATLLQGLGGDTEKAVQYADLAITDMSDNANKMGTDMGMIQNAYNGFAKQNYTMLDNLKLGYGGTQAEMARLINDSGVLGDTVKVTANTVKDVPFDKVIEAIHKTQQEIGITGTTSLEAASTLEGSTKSMQAAWQNLLVGIADGKQDISPLLNDLVSQVVTMGKNMIPRIEEIISGMVEAVSIIWDEVLPELAEQFPELQPIVDGLMWVGDNASYIASGIASIAAGFAAFKAVATITSIIEGIKTFAATIQAAGGVMAWFNGIIAANPIGLLVTAIAALVAGFVVLWNTNEDFRNFWIEAWNGIKTTFENVWNALSTFFTDTIPNAFNSCKETILQWKDNIVSYFQELPGKISEVVNNVIQWFQQLPYNLGYAVGSMIGHLVKFGVDAWSWVSSKVPQIINGIIKFFAELPGKTWNHLVNTYNKIVTWGSNTASKASEAGSKFVQNVISFVKNLPSNMWTWLQNAITKVSTFASDLAKKGSEGAKNMANNVINGITSLPSKVASIGKNIVEGLWNGIKNAGDWIKEKVGGFAKGILDGMKDALGIHSPSRLFRDEVGKYIAQGVGVGFSDEMKDVANDMQNSIPTSFDVATTVKRGKSNGSSDISSVMVSAFKQALSEMKVELDSDEVGRFVDKTVMKAVYA